MSNIERNGEQTRLSVDADTSGTAMTKDTNPAHANQSIVAGIKEELGIILFAPAYLVRVIKRGRWPAGYELDAVLLGLMAYLFLVLALFKTLAPVAWDDLPGMMFVYSYIGLGILMMGCIVYCQVTRTKQRKRKRRRGGVQGSTETPTGG